MKWSNLTPYGWDVVKLLLSAFLGFLFAYFTFSKQYDATEKGRLNEDLNKLLDVSLQYPYVEDSFFIARWARNDSVGNDNALRYETYCTYVFNYAQNLCEYFDYDERKIDGFVDITNLVDQHKMWWTRPDEKNYKSYPDKFRAFIDQIYKNDK